MKGELILILVTAAASSVGHADEIADARAHFEAGKRAYETGDYRAAIEAFKAAMLLRPSPLLVYNVARCHEMLVDYAEAARVYRGYLRQFPDAPDRVAVAKRIRELEEVDRQLGHEPGPLSRAKATTAVPASAPDPAPPLASVVSAVASRREGAREPGRDQHRRLRWTWVAAGTTLATVVGASVSSGLFVTRRSEMRGGCSQTEAGCSAATIDGLQARANAANALWGIAAAAAVVTAGVLWLEVRAARRVTLAAGPGSLALRVRY